MRNLSDRLVDLHPNLASHFDNLIALTTSCLHQSYGSILYFQYFYRRLSVSSIPMFGEHWDLMEPIENLMDPILCQIQ